MLHENVRLPAFVQAEPVQAPVAIPAETDPVFDLIARHVAAWDAFLVAVKANDPTERREAGLDMSPGALGEVQQRWEACDRADRSAWAQVVACQPTTPAGLDAWIAHIERFQALHDSSYDEAEEIIEALREANLRRVLTVAPLAGACRLPDALEAGALVEAIEREWAAQIGPMIAYENEDETPEAEARNEERLRRRDALIKAADRLSPCSREARHAKALARAYSEWTFNVVPGSSRDGRSLDDRLVIDIEAALIASPPSTPTGPDPILAAIEAHRAAHTWAIETSGADRFIADGELDAICDVEREAFAALRATVPTTAAGLLALADYLPEYLRRADKDFELPRLDRNASYIDGALCLFFEAAQRFAGRTVIEAA